MNKYYRMLEHFELDLVHRQSIPEVSDMFSKKNSKRSNNVHVWNYRMQTESSDGLHWQGR